MTFTSYPDITDVLYVPGLLFWGTTSLSTEAGYGTKLGYCNTGITFEPRVRTVEFTGSETGEEPIMELFLGYAPRVFADLMNYNATALARLFPSLTSSTAVSYPSASALPGKNLFSSTSRLLFVPDDTANNPILLLHHAVAHIIAAAKLRLIQSDPTIFPAVFLAKTNISDGSRVAGSSFYLGPLSGATLL